MSSQENQTTTNNLTGKKNLILVSKLTWERSKITFLRIFCKRKFTNASKAHWMQTIIHNPLHMQSCYKER